MKPQKICYALLPCQMADPSIKDVDVIIIKEGESGYYPTDWKWKKEFAEQARDEKNAKLGLTPLEADQMLIASMFLHEN
jgi:hypothetical protein